MPKKSKTKKKSGGKGKGKGGEKAAAKAAAAAEAEEMLKTCKKFIKSYQVQCSATGSIPSQRILRDLRTCVENERPLPKVYSTVYTVESTSINRTLYLFLN